MDGRPRRERRIQNEPTDTKQSDVQRADKEYSGLTRPRIRAEEQRRHKGRKADEMDGC